MKKRIKYFDAFSGMGVASLAIQKAYESNNEHAHIGKKSELKKRQQGGVRSADKHRIQLHTRNRTAPLCVGFSEIDKYATKVYQKHFPEHKNYGNIRNIKEKELPDFDIFVGGFPCQAFSIAGKRKGFEDTRGTLFFDIARILRAKRPRLLLLENVKGLLNHDNGETFKTIINALAKMGYDLQWQVLNSKNFAVPQNRERIYIIGHLRGTRAPQVFSLGKNGIRYFESAEEGIESETSSTIATKEGSRKNDNFIIQLNQPIRSNNRVYSQEDISPTLNTMQGGARQPFVALSGDGSDKNKKAHASRMRSPSGNAGQLDRMSDTQRYKLCGNGMTRTTMQALFEILLCSKP